VDGPASCDVASPAPARRWALRHAAFGAGYAALAVASYGLVDRPGGLAIVWLPSGLYFAWLLVLPRAAWPGALLAAAVASVGGSLAYGRAPALAAEMWLGNTLEAAAAALLVGAATRERGGPGSVRWVALVCGVPAMTTLAVAGALQCAFAATTGRAFEPTFWVFWAGSALGVVAVAPALFAWRDPALGGPLRPRALELALLVAAHAAAAGAVLASPALTSRNELLLLPPMLWAAVRFGPRGATASVPACAAALALATAGVDAAGAGALATVLAAQLALGVLATTALVVAAAMTERRRTAAELRESRDLFRAFLEHSPAAMLIADRSGRPRFASRQALGLARAGAPDGGDLPSPALAALFAEVRTSGAPVQRSVASEGRTLLVSAFAIPRGEAAPELGTVAVDLTARVRAEEALRESEARLALIREAVDRSADPVGVIAEDGMVSWANEAFCRLTGLRREDVLGRHVEQVAPIAGGERWAERWERLVRDRTLLCEDAVPVPGGGAEPWEVAASLAEHGGRRYCVVSLRDLRQRRRAEATARLAGVGTLAAGIAHEINNPLAYVLGNVVFAREALARLAPSPAVDEVSRALEEAEGGAQRVRDIVRDLRLFARTDSEPGPADAAQAVRSALAIAQHELRHRARVATRFDEVPSVAGDERRLSQVVLNLLVNAAQATPEGRADEHEIAVSVTRAGPGEVAIEVRDDGAGMPDAVRARLFEPFFTTKPPGQGTGLGLSICHGIVTGVGGRIEVETAPGRGSRFRVVLPAAEGAPRAAAAVAAAVPAPPAVPRRSRVLVVDDEPMVARVAARILHADHEVVAVTGGREAVDLVARGERFDAVVCDLMMPEMTGAEVHAELSRVAPALAARMVFVTGGAFTPTAQAFADGAAGPTLHKPYRAEELRRAVAERLGAA
jgi:PAS domain S-box-containing protein